MSEIERLADEVALEETALEELYAELERRGVDVHEDAGRTVAEPPTWVNGDLASATTDALQLFLIEAGRYPLLTAAEEVALAKRIGRGDQERRISWSTRTFASSSRSRSAIKATTSRCST